MLQVVAVPITSNIKMNNTDFDHYNNETICSMVLNLLSEGNFYYSAGYNLTSSLQKQHEVPNAAATAPLWDRLDINFTWNHSLCRAFTSCKDRSVLPFVSPIICGHVEEATRCTMNNDTTNFKLLVIARRSTRMQGTRYNKRGVDFSGNASNFCEIEQIVERGADVYSFVQVRGSIPVIWKQYPDLTAVPRVDFYESYDVQTSSCKAHFDSLKANYGENILGINLVSKSGDQKRLGQKYEACKPAWVRLVWFDFNHECRKLRYENLSILLREIEGELEPIGYFALSNGAIKSTQKGVVRTNCLDNLDRTNVVQGLVGRQVLMSIMGCPNEEKRRAVMSSDHAGMEYMFKNIWTNVGDAMSVAYAGTGALKTDFTRTGKRTVWGAVSDAQRSCMRYVHNNFWDGAQQDSIDLVLGPPSSLLPSVSGKAEGGGAGSSAKSTGKVYKGSGTYRAALHYLVLVFVVTIAVKVAGFTEGFDRVYHILYCHLYSFLAFLLIQAWFMRFGGGAAYVHHPKIYTPLYNQF
jgi:hypothetical protein